MTKRIKKLQAKKLPTDIVKSVQLDLFGLFVTNDKSEVSNTVEAWENIPKYFFTTKQVEGLRTSDGLATPYKWEYSYKGMPFVVRIQPALIEQVDGGYKAFFPSVTEEFVEEALKKILSDQQYGIHDKENVETWVKFSLKMVHKELKARGRTRSLDQIKHAITVMNKCNIEVFGNGKAMWSGAILQDLVTVDRKGYIANASALHAARLPLFISHAINRIEYRQFNYDRLMSCNEQLTRWIYKRLIHRFTQASFITDYHFMYSDLQESGLLQQATEGKNRQKVISALEELVKREILMNYEVNKRKEGQKIIDVKYTVYPALEFVREQKAANKRIKDVLSKARGLDLSLVDK